MIAKIAVAAANFAIDKPYSYYVPENLTVRPGQRVMLPFGRANKRTEGIVLTVEEGSADKLKAIERCLDEEAVLTESQLRLAAFLRERYFCTFFDAIRVMLPAGLWFRTKLTVFLTEDRSWKEKTIRKENAGAVLELLENLGGQAEEDALRNLIADEDALSEVLTYLTRKKWVSAQTDYLRKTHDKSERIATLAVPAEEAMAYAEKRPKSAAMQKQALELLCSVGSVAVKDLCYFTGASTATVNRLESLGYLTLTERPVLRCREIRPAQLDGPLVLNREQQACFEGLDAQMGQEAPGVALLYGVTGSGKTSVYIRLIQACLERGKAAMLLVPEIALTPQLLGVLAAYFGAQVAVLHSSLSTAERYDQWKRVKNGDAKVVVGTRSAVFAPCDPGLIILDEEQEHSYKSESSPRYSAKEVAIWRGAKENALVLLGSATPSIESMYRAKTGAYHLYTLRQRYNGRPLPDVDIVDMREELKLGNDTSLSIPLREDILRTWDAGKQTILLLNRRGNSRALVCVDCRETPECPRCNVKLTYHSANNRLMCHYCGFSQWIDDACPDCGGTLQFVGAGTQMIEQELEQLFPGVEIMRMDTDSVTPVGSHEELFARFRKERVPIMVGTQMVTKGLNFENVTLVGVISADQSLYAGTYRAGERAFSLITQVVGRSGRGAKPGRAIIQTFTPDNEIIRQAARQDYEDFYRSELELRRLQNTPPFSELMAITASGQVEEHVMAACRYIKTWLDKTAGKDGGALILGPSPLPVVRVNNRYRYRVTICGKGSQSIRALVARIVMDCSVDKRFSDVSIFADNDPLD